MDDETGGASAATLKRVFGWKLLLGEDETVKSAPGTIDERILGAASPYSVDIGPSQHTGRPIAAPQAIFDQSTTGPGTMVLSDTSTDTGLSIPACSPSCWHVLIWTSWIWLVVLN